ncbi:hypothetical protein Droror1_Dr00004376 [Drosera rotundifolia]
MDIYFIGINGLSRKLRVDQKRVSKVRIGLVYNVMTSDNSRETIVPVGGCYQLNDIPMSNCINSGINKIFILTRFNSASLHHHISRTYHGNGINFGDGFVEVLAATQTPGEAGMNWFQGAADAVRQFLWLFELMWPLR